jgi:hypothetical protein
MSIKEKHKALEEIAGLAVEVVVLQRGKESERYVAQLVNAALDLADEALVEARKQCKGWWDRDKITEKRQELQALRPSPEGLRRKEGA